MHFRGALHTPKTGDSISITNFSQIAATSSDSFLVDISNGDCILIEKCKEAIRFVEQLFQVFNKAR